MRSRSGKKGMGVQIAKCFHSEAPFVPVSLFFGTKPQVLGRRDARAQSLIASPHPTYVCVDCLT